MKIAPDGTVYGTTEYGGGACPSKPWGCGTVFRWAPPPRSSQAPYIIYRFQGEDDGAYPKSDLTFDNAGNIYGTTQAGGFSGTQKCRDGCGTVYKLSRSNGSWVKTTIHTFRGSDGAHPWGGVVFDRAGNLYGTTTDGGHANPNCAAGCGVVYQLTPSGSGWTQQILHVFAAGEDGELPIGSLMFDGAGNLYGTTSQGGSRGSGTVFEMTPENGSWIFKTLYAVPGPGLSGEGVRGNVVMDAAGNLYGTTYEGGAHARGAVFKLTAQSDGTWMYTSLHDFDDPAYGWFVVPGVVLDSNGNVYGMTEITAGGCGNAFQITP